MYLEKNIVGCISNTKRGRKCQGIHLVEGKTRSIRHVDVRYFDISKLGYDIQHEGRMLSHRFENNEQVHRNFAELQVYARMTHVHLRVVNLNLAKVGSLVLCTRYQLSCISYQRTRYQVRSIIKADALDQQCIAAGTWSYASASSSCYCCFIADCNSILLSLCMSGSSPMTRDIDLQLACYYRSSAGDVAGYATFFCSTYMIARF